jgi:hypothetical protein
MKAGAVKRVSKRHKQGRLRILTKRRDGLRRHVALLSTFPTESLCTWEQGQLSYFRGQIEILDRLIAELKG